MHKRVLLTGIGGFIGSHVMDHILVNTDWEIVGIASWKHRGTPERVTESDHYQKHKERVTIITHDLQSPIPELTRKRIGKIDYVFNVAAESHVDRSITDPVPFVQNNVNLVLNMLEYAREAKPSVFMQISTDEVYGAAGEGESHAEWAEIKPSNPYSASKAAQEAIAISYWRTYNVPVVITNCFDMETKVMTPGGLKRYEDINEGDMVWTYNDNEELVQTKVLEKVRMPYSGNMVSIQTSKVNQVITPNHRMFIKTRHGKPAKLSNIKEVLAENMIDIPRSYIPLTGRWSGDDISEHAGFDADPLVALMGWYVSEGFKANTTGVCFGAGSRGQQAVISELICELGLKPTVSGRSVRVYSKELRLITDKCGELAISKVIPDWIMQLGQRQLRIFFDAAIAGDGSINRKGNATVYYTKSYRLAEQMMEIGMKLGYGVRLSERRTWNPAKTQKSKSYIVRFRLDYACVEPQNIGTVPYTDDVWCIRTSVGRVFVERGGVVSLSGQTMNNFGQRQDGEKYVSKIVTELMRDGVVTAHMNPQTGKPGSRKYLHARNHADALVFLAKSLDGVFPFFPEVEKPPRYNIVGEAERDNVELIHDIAKILGKEPKFELIDAHSSRPGHDPRYSLDGSKLKNMGYVFPFSYEDSLRKTVEWYLKNMEWII